MSHPARPDTSAPALVIKLTARSNQIVGYNGD